MNVVGVIVGLLLVAWVSRAEALFVSLPNFTSGELAFTDVHYGSDVPGPCPRDPYCPALPALLVGEDGFPLVEINGLLREKGVEHGGFSATIHSTNPSRLISGFRVAYFGAGPWVSLGGEGPSGLSRELSEPLSTAITWIALSSTENDPKAAVYVSYVTEGGAHSVPEPNVFLLVGMGLAVLIGVRNNTRRITRCLT